jgi:hypothetical protein
MKGTPEQITAKKACRIRSNVRQFFRYYREQLENTESELLKEFNRAELQALETVQAETLQALESLTDAELLANKTAYGDRALIDRTTVKAAMIRKTSRDFEDYRKKAYNYNWQPKKAYEN